jgi:hypothetical protein
MCEHDFTKEVGKNPENQCKKQYVFTCKKCGFWEFGDTFIECEKLHLQQRGLRRTPSYGIDCTLNVCMDCGTNVEI